MKRTIYLITLSVITCICIVIGFAIHSGFGWNLNAFSITSSAKRIHVAKTLNPFQNISVNLNTVDINVKQGDKFQITYTGEQGRKPKMYVENNTLYVKYNPKFTIFLLGFNNRENVQITVPKNTNLGRVTLKGDVSDLSLSNLTIQDLRTDVDTGDMDMKTVSVKEAKLESDTGDMMLDQVTLQNATLSTDTGDIKVNNLSDKQNYVMDFSTDTGDVTVNGKEYDHNYNYDSDGNYTMNIQTDTGDVEVNFGK